jgi:hypothetical protein
MGCLIVFFGTFIAWAESLNNYDINLVDFPAIKEKIKESLETITTVPNTDTAVIGGPVGADQTTVLLKVPFTSQAPDGQWEDLRFQDGCEEASVLMAIKWVKGESITRTEATAAILDMAEWQLQSYGSFRDTNAQDTADRLIRDYFSYNQYRVSKEVNTQNIVAELRAGNIVLVPANGQKLYNPYFTAPGPEHHMLVIRGYHPSTDEFITNDPGTKRGEGYRYKSEILIGAVIDYPTGDHEPITGVQKAMIIVSK